MARAAAPGWSLHRAAGEIVGIDVAQDQVGVGDGRLRAAAPVADRAQASTMRSPARPRSRPALACAIEPPPAPISTRSIAWMFIGRPLPGRAARAECRAGTLRVVVNGAGPCRRCVASFAVVPPMSNAIEDQRCPVRPPYTAAISAHGGAQLDHPDQDGAHRLHRQRHAEAGPGRPARDRALAQGPRGGRAGRRAGRRRGRGHHGGGGALVLAGTSAGPRAEHGAATSEAAEATSSAGPASRARG